MVFIVIKLDCEVDNMNNTNRRNSDNSFGIWYKVCFVPIKSKYQVIDENRRDTSNFVFENLRLDNINGWGIGTLFFTNERNQLVVLDWRSIISMYPLNNADETTENVYPITKGV